MNIDMRANLRLAPDMITTNAFKVFSRYAPPLQFAPYEYDSKPEEDNRREGRRR